jgi:hypothetical protein
VDYEERLDPEWLRKALDEFTREELDDRLRYTGPCPHCTHEITVDVPIPLNYADAIEEKEPADKGAADAPAFDGRCRCNCTEGHPPEAGKEVPTTGCGRYAYAFLE